MASAQEQDRKGELSQAVGAIVIAEVAGDAPVLLLVEDAQWVDRPTSDVLAFIARRIESDPIVLLVATRDGYPSALGDAGLPEHRLSGLDDATAGASRPRSSRRCMLRVGALTWVSASIRVNGWRRSSSDCRYVPSTSSRPERSEHIT